MQSIDKRALQIGQELNLTNFPFHMITRRRRSCHVRMSLDGRLRLANAISLKIVKM